MSFDEDMRDRFAQHVPTITSLDDGVVAAAKSASRRTAVARGVAAMVMIAIVGVGALALASRGDDVADVATENDSETAEGLAEVAEGPAEIDDGPADVDDLAEGTDETTLSDEIEGDQAEELPTQSAEPPNGEPVTPAAGEDGEGGDEPTEDILPIVDGLVFAIQNVAADDTLNARSGPGTDNAVVFEFASNATGVLRTDADPVTVGSSIWIQVFAPTSGQDTAEGWVNSSFLEPIAVPVSVPCVFNGPQEDIAGFDVANTEGDATIDNAVVSSIDTYRFGSCLRTIIELSDGFTSSNDPSTRLTTLPADIELLGSPDAVIEFGPSLVGAEVADERFVETSGVEHSTFIYRSTTGNIEAKFYRPATSLDVTFDNDNGRIIIDTPDALSPDLSTQGPLLDEGSLILQDVRSEANDRLWTITGLARPFEANLPVEIVANGEPIVVEWTGGFLTEPSASNGIRTTSWLEWGIFTFSIELDDGVDPADVIVRFDETGGATAPQYIDVPLADFLG